MTRFLVLNSKDNVAVALEPAKREDQAMLSNGKVLKLKQDVPFAHKIAIQPLKAGDKVIKYGEVIGEATSEINQGDYVHIHNIRSIYSLEGRSKK